MMKFKHFNKSFFAVLLVIAMLLSACAIFASCSDDPEPNQNDPGTNPPTLSNCTHAQTTKKNQRAATCTEAGYTGDDVCTACGAVVKTGEAIAVLAHAWDAGQITKDPTCIEQGVKTITCTGCLTTKTESVPVVAHRDEYHDALDGTHSHTCTTCTMSEFKEHTPTDAGKVYAATCTTDAYTEYTCSVCEGVYRVYSTTEKATGHAWGEWSTVAATCIAAGSKTRECGTCGEDEVLTIDVVPSAHNYVEVGQRKLATCVAVGTIYYQCTHCEGTTTKEIPINHNAHALSAAVQSGSFLRQECALCDFEVSKLVATSTNATVSAGDIETGRALEIETTDASVQFPKDVVSQLTGNKDATVAVSAGVAADKAGILNKAQNLTQEQKDRLSSDGVDIYDFGVTVGGDPLSQFDSTITVVLPYTLKEGEDPNGIVIWYVAEDGSIEQYPAVYENGTVTFQTKHFSYYAIAYEETQESKCRRGIHRWMENPYVLEPTCQHLGYTRNECDTCHTVELHNVQERLEHEYGELIQPTVNCTEGGFVHKICAKCEHVLELTYVRATGHTLTTVATCTTGAYCDVCEELVRPATGHNWSEWTVVVEPSETTVGLRRRNCPKCGTVENVNIAYTGNIEKLQFNSYDDIANFLVTDVLNMENGKISLGTVITEHANGPYYLNIDFTINKEGESYAMLIDYRMSESENDPFADHVQILYRNGVALMLEDYSAWDVDTLLLLTGNVFEGMFEMPFVNFREIADKTFDSVAPTFEPVIDNLGTLFEVLDALFAEEVDAALANADSTYTVGKLASAYQQIKNTYAYWAYKMGFQTGLSYDGTVNVVTRQEILDTLSHFMTVEKDATGTHYTWDCTELMEAVDTVLDWFQENEKKTMAELLWQEFGADVTAKYPDVKSFEDAMQALRDAFPGTTPMKDVLDDLIAFLDGKKAGATASLYAMVDAIAKVFMAGGTEFDSEEYLLSMVEEGTLDDLAAMILKEEEATVSDLFDNLEGMLTGMTLGTAYSRSAENEQGERVTITLADYVKTAREAIDRITMTDALSFSLDAKGDLTAFSYDNKLEYAVGEEGNTKNVTFEQSTLTVTRDESVKIELPEALQSAVADKVTATFNELGQLVVKVPAGYDMDFRVESIRNLNPQLSDVLEKDEEMSRELGVDVYVTKEAYWQNQGMYSSSIYYKVDGVYYKRWDNFGEKNNYEKIVSLAELQKNPSVLLPDEEDFVGYYVEGDNEYRVYRTALLSEYGNYFAFLLDGEWYLKKQMRDYADYSGDTRKEWDATTGQMVSKEYVSFREEVELVSFNKVFSNVEISSIEKWRDGILVDGVERDLLQLYVSLDISTWGTTTMTAYGYIDYEDNINFCRYADKGSATTLIPFKGTPEGTCTSYYAADIEREFCFADGTKVQSKVYVVEFEITEKTREPRYYAKVGGELYVDISYLVTNPAHRHLKNTLTLPDGNVMYVLGERAEGGEFFGKEYDDYAFGYIKLSDGLFTEVIALRAGGEVVDVRYRYATDTYMGVESWLELEDYMVKADDTTYIFAKELFTLLQGLCKEEGDGYTLRANGYKCTDNMQIRLKASLACYVLTPDQIAFGGMETERDFDWDSMFYNMENQPAFRIMTNKEGTVSIYFDAGAEVEVWEYELDDRYPADSYMVKDQAMSNQYGLNVYSYSFDFMKDQSYSEYVYKDGKYYPLDWDYVYDFEYASSLAACFSDAWVLEDIYFRYTIPAADITGGKELRAYHSWLHFYAAPNDAISVYFTVKDGVLMALLGAEEESERVLRFESMMPFSDYIAMLISSVTENEDYGSFVEDQFLYVDGEYYAEEYQYVNMTERNEAGEVIREHLLCVRFFEKDSVKKYAKNVLNKGRYLFFDEERALDALPAYDEIYEEEETFYNGLYTVSELVHYEEHKDYAVKLAGKYYDLEYYMESYGPRITEYEFRERMSESEEIYFIQLPNGTNKYYSRVDIEYGEWDSYGVLSDPIDEEYANRIELGTYAPLSVSTEKGEQIYCFYGYLATEWDLVEEPQGDGTVFYHREGLTKGYLKDQKGYYVRASKIVADDGSSYILCHTTQVSIDDYYIDEIGAFADFVTFNRDETVVTISRELLEWIEQKDLEKYFVIRLRSYDRYGEHFVTLNYYQLAAWLELADAGELVPGDAGDPTLQSDNGYWN
ncbi:MAG: hypothetical protein E7624_03885 [Ruminococcaceae bacterium]|nr:hypothetical protein [Oscillospiraceae bacterium]